MEDPSPPNPQNQTRPGIPSGPRPLHQYASSSRISSSSSIPKVNTAYDWSIRSQPSLSSLSNLDVLGSSPNVLPDGEPQLTARSEESPWADQSANGSPSRTPSFYTSVSANRDPGSTTADARSDDRYGPTVGYQQAPSSRPGTPASFVVSRPSTPVSSPPVKPKPKPLRLKTTDLILPTTSPPSKAISPSLKHRQQVRTRVLATSPTDDRASEKSERTGGKKLGIVSKAAGRFGFRQAAENVMGYNEKRSTTLSLTREFGQLSVEEKEEITRERRKFARDIRACLDACALDESRRRLWRLASDGREPAQDPKNVAPSVHASQHTAQRFSFDPEFSAFAPLLTELHRHLPAARARKPWSRTCPHHAAILAELGVAFLPISANTQGERQQALEVFGAVVRNWAPDDEEEELDRWLWLCRALLVDDRQIRNRGLPLLASFLHADTTLPRSPQRPQAALAFRNLAGALLELLHSVETSSVRSSEHLTMVGGFLVDLTEGDILEVDQTSLADFLRLDGLSESHGGLARELSWMAVGRVFGQRPGLAAWLLQADGEKLKVRDATLADRRAHTVTCLAFLTPFDPPRSFSGGPAPPGPRIILFPELILPLDPNRRRFRCRLKDVEDYPRSPDSGHPCSFGR
jgi:hypothetical protein